MALDCPRPFPVFGTVDNASVSDWHALKTGRAMSQADEDTDAVFANKRDQFGARGEYPRAKTISADDLENISFYAFHRLFYVQGNRLHKRHKERFLSISGLGYPAQAARDHAEHEFYARRTLYAYMPCAGFQGVEYIDDIVQTHFEGSYAELLQVFINDKLNLWCPTWVRQNYNVRNQMAQVQKKEQSSTTTPAEPHCESTTVNKRKHVTRHEPAEPDDNDDEDQAADSLDPWSSQYRQKWQ